MKRGAIKITWGMLHDLLKLTDHVNITDIIVSEHERMNESVLIKLGGESPNFVEHIDGSPTFFSPIEDFQR